MVVRVLYVDPDPHVRQTVKKGFESAGVEIVALGEARQALSYLASSPVDAVVCALEPGGSEGNTFLSGAQSRLAATPMVVVSAFYTEDDPELAPLFILGQNIAFVAKPFTTGDLGRALRTVMKTAGGAPTPAPPRPAPAAPTTQHGASRPPPPAPATLHGQGAIPRAPTGGTATLHGAGGGRRQPDARNLSLLTRLWATRSTGTLRVVGGPGGLEGWASFNRGGPGDAESARLVTGALFGGELAFEPGEVDVAGDWDGMADLLWKAARDPGQRSFALENRFQALSKTQWSALLLSLPLATATRRLLANISPSTTLGEAIAKSGVDDEVVSPDLQALTRLKIIAMGAPGPAPGAAAPGRPGEPTSPTTRRVDPTSAPPSAGPSQSRGHSGVATLSVGRSATASVSRPALHPSTATQGASRHGADGVRGMPTSTGSGVTSTAVNARARDRINSVLRYLRGEVNNLGSAPPAVLLGVPVDASNELVLEAARRLRERYQGMIQDSSLDDEAHKLATQMLERVEEAAKNFGKARSAAAAGAMDEERLLVLAHELINQRQWDQAERVLTRARQLKADHVGVIANLGWARLHNPARPAADRANGALELLELAEQFDPQHAEGQYYLAELLYRLGEYARALPRAERAMRAAPENPAASSLARKLRNRLNPSNG